MMTMPTHLCNFYDNDKEHIEQYDWRERPVVVNTILLDIKLCDETHILASNTVLLIQFLRQYYITRYGIIARRQDSLDPRVVAFVAIQLFF